MSNLNPEHLTPDIKGWFGGQIRDLAIRHDLAGPDIGRVNLHQYTKQLIDEFQQRAGAAVKAHELLIPSDDLEGYCTRAAEELIRIRQIRAAYKGGDLSVEDLRTLPLFEAFRDYFEELPELFYDQMVAATRELLESETDPGSGPLSRPGQPKHPVSRATREWMQLQAFGLACADDAWGAPFATLQRDAYIEDGAVRIRQNARRAIRIGDLQVKADDVDKICWVAACEAYLLRSLKAAKDSGKLSHEQIKRMPIYGPYHEYFEIGAQLASMATRIAAAAGRPVTPPAAQN